MAKVNIYCSSVNFGSRVPVAMFEGAIPPIGATVHIEYFNGFEKEDGYFLVRDVEMDVIGESIKADVQVVKLSRDEYL